MPGSPVAVLELRQYTLHPGRREALVALFEREFIAPQEALGITLAGPYEDLDAPDRFVWWRGFRDLPARAQSLAAFYGGPVWAAHRDAANATMIDSDDVLLLRPLDGLPSVLVPAPARPPAAAMLVTVCPLRAEAASGFVQFFRDALLPALRARERVIGCHATEAAPNNFPRLPVREGAPMFVWCSAAGDRAELDRLVSMRERDPAWGQLAEWLAAVPQRLRLVATAHARRV